MKKIAFFLTVPVACCSIAANAASSADDGFVACWTKFRAAALHNDMAGLEMLTRLPLVAALEADQDRPVHVTRAQFPSLFRTELGCPAHGFGSTLNMIQHRTNQFGPFDYHIKQDPREAPHLEGRAIVDRFSFEKSAGQWRLTGVAYGDMVEYHNRLKGRC